MDDREEIRELLNRSVIAVPLLQDMADEGEPTVGVAEQAAAPRAPRLFHVVIDLSWGHGEGLDGAARRVRSWITEIVGRSGTPGEQVVDRDPTPTANRPTPQYLTATLSKDTITKLAARDARAGRQDPSSKAIYRIWPDFEVQLHTTRSVCTIKADAARSSFAAWGEGIVWAVIDTGVSGTHPHFRTHRNLDLPSPVAHVDFTGGGSPLTDEAGHGTHVAGILAGASRSTRARPVLGARRYFDENGDPQLDVEEIPEIAGMAPRCKIVSYKVLDADGHGQSSTIMDALREVDRVNEHGRTLRIHGVNLSVGYPFDPQWFACGHSPLCTEVNRLVDSGVVVVVSAGNTGYGMTLDSSGRQSTSAGIGLSINDPGNADRAITVGATHRDSPHLYGVSFFSSKGPTGDGRLKPDLLAPGERILAPASGLLKGADTAYQYVEDSGTSMAAPHVSGAAAAFLSVRNEFIGRPTDLKQILIDSAMDLGREPYFQGHGLIDLFRALQSV